MGKFDESSIRKALDFIFRHGSETDKDDYSSVVAHTNRFRHQREDLLTGRANPYEHAHHPIEDLEEGIRHGRDQLAAKLRALRRTR